MDDYIEFVRMMIDNGYIDEKNFEPLKCQHCESKKLVDVDHDYMDGHLLLEYSVKCKDCGRYVGNWAYGSWQV